MYAGRALSTSLFGNEIPDATVPSGHRRTCGYGHACPESSCPPRGMLPIFQRWFVRYCEKSKKSFINLSLWCTKSNHAGQAMHKKSPYIPDVIDFVAPAVATPKPPTANSARDVPSSVDLAGTIFRACDERAVLRPPPHHTFCNLTLRGQVTRFFRLGKAFSFASLFGRNS